MSFISKGDFKTRQEWLKRQRKEIMKKQSQKYHQMNQPQQGQRTSFDKKKETVVDKQRTLKNILTLETEAGSIASSYLSEQPQVNFKNQRDGQLFGSMNERLSAQKLVTDKQRQQIRELDKQIQQLSTQNAISKGVFDEASGLYQNINKKQEQNNQLKQLYQQMQQYLNQNGAQWHNGQISGQINVSKIKKDIKEAKTDYRTPNSFQFDAVVKRIEELNEALLNQFGSKKFVNVEGVYKLCEVPRVKVTFYKDGVLFYSIGFYQYSSKDGKRILGDLVEGYYPHLLRKPYPEGVLMQFESHLANSFQGEQKQPLKGVKKDDWFKGQSYSLDK